MRILITGADGFIGSHLCASLAEAGHGIVPLVRDPKLKKIAGAFHFSFPDHLDLAALEAPAHTLIHCAFAMRDPTDPARYAQNRRAALYLRDLARSRNLHFVFISSMSAHSAAESLYGKEKLFIEQQLDPAADCAIRPGFVIGNGGVFVNLARSIRAFPFLPLFFGGRQPVHTVAIDDLCAAIRVIAERRLTGLLKFAEREPVQLRTFYEAIALGIGASTRAIPLPGEAALAVVRIAERFRIPLPMTSDNLLGLKHLIAYNLSADLATLGLEPKTMPQSLAQLDWRAI